MSKEIMKKLILKVKIRVGLLIIIKELNTIIKMQNKADIYVLDPEKLISAFKYYSSLYEKLQINKK